MAVHSSMLVCKISRQRSLVDCGPWDHKESMTEAAEHTHQLNEAVTVDLILRNWYPYEKKFGHTDSRDASAERKDHARTCQGHSCLQANERDYRRSQNRQHLDLGLLVSRTGENSFLSFQALSQWYFVIEALTSDKYTVSLALTQSLLVRVTQTETGKTHTSFYLLSLLLFAIVLRTCSVPSRRIKNKWDKAE